MICVNSVRGEVNRWLTHLLRWLPGAGGSKIRYSYYRRRLADCGLNVIFSEGCFIRDCQNITIGHNSGLGLYSQIYAKGTGKERIVIGDHVSLNSNVMINADMDGHIAIGNNCLIGPNVVLRTSNHAFTNAEIPMREQGHEPGTIIVEDNVWIGANVSIIGNVKIGSGAVVGAGAVVIRDVAEKTIVGGVPAKAIGTR